MGSTDRAHLDDLAADELQPVVLPQDAQFGEPLVGFQREGTLEQLLHHVHNFGSASGPSQSGRNVTVRRHPMRARRCRLSP